VRNNGWNQNTGGIPVPNTQCKKVDLSGSQFFNLFVAFSWEKKNLSFTR